MKNPEDEILENITVDQAYQAAKRTLEKEAIQPGQFIDLYNKDSIESDETHVKKMEIVFAKTGGPEQEKVQKLATIFEATIHEHAEQSEWFGPDAFTIKTSRYDDIQNGVDSIAEFRENEMSASYLGLAIDVTMSAEMGKKFERIRQEIERGELAKIKYFHSEHMNIRGELTKVPRVVIGATAQTIKQLAELSLEKNMKALANHPIQFQILEEMMAQLEAFKKYAEGVNKSELASIYEKTHALVKKIYKEKKETVRDNGERDNALDSIHVNLYPFRVTPKEKMSSPTQPKTSIPAQQQKRSFFIKRRVR
ncbi:hypothetical protein HY967_00705 [Candidatus Jorgensenbacteria bacterium]|nr:hypothetical protein [Candidatus Jorgensenbacteria bacterium]